MPPTKEKFGKASDSAPVVRSQFFEIVNGFGMFPNKVLHKVNMVEILQNARVGTAVHFLPSMNLLRVSLIKNIL